MEQKTIYELNMIQRYMMQMRPVLNRQGLFSDGTPDYREPAEPKAWEDVTIRFRTKKDNVDAVYLCAGDESILMEKTESCDGMDYYACTVTMTDQLFTYCFKVADGMLTLYYDNYGTSRELRPEYFFRIMPGFSTPDWAKGAVMYQIYVDRFYNGDPSNDVETNEYYYINGMSKKVGLWDRVPSNFSVAEFYGGDLEGVRQKLDYLQKLGIEVIYFNPLFVSPSNHKYDIQDYDYIDPHVGKIIEDGGELLDPEDTDNRNAGRYIKRVTDKRNLRASNQFFAKLVQEIHNRGMKVILDGVFNHCGSFHKWLDREQVYSSQKGYQTGAYLSEDSPYKDFFQFSDDQAWPQNTSYEGWWGHDTLPKLNYEGSRELYDYIIGIGKKWVSPPYNVDGWRLDVAADLGHGPEFNHQFWRDFRAAVKEANPNALILAEHYGDATSWLLGDQWDTIMNYDAFMEPVTWFLTGMDKHSERFEEEALGNAADFENEMKRCMNHFLAPSLHCAMNQLSNHDHSRFLTRTNHKAGRAHTLGVRAASEGVNKGVFREAVVIQMTWPGAPTLYYGDEAGVCGFTDPDNRRTYPWGREDHDLVMFHRDMISIHKKHQALRRGSVKFLLGEHNLLCYARFTRAEQMIILINNGVTHKDVDLYVWTAGIPQKAQLKQLMFTNETGYSTLPVFYQVEEGRLKLTLPRYSSVVLIRQDDSRRDHGGY